ncbi:hypothetical protein HanPI659440_Chr10g0372821 [Helianthus annuus]|nr:hypothetical protein HanPI659440_Chr10g0372821 [Helianthus annuus]
MFVPTLDLEAALCRFLMVINTETLFLLNCRSLLNFGIYIFVKFSYSVYCVMQPVYVFFSCSQTGSYLLNTPSKFVPVFYALFFWFACGPRVALNH